MNTPPQIRIELINRSMRCFVLGLISLVPLVGLPVAILVLAQNWLIRRRARGLWNPAASYLHWGCVCACIAMLVSLVVAFIIGLSIATNSSGGTYKVGD